MTERLVLDLRLKGFGAKNMLEYWRFNRNGSWSSEDRSRS